MSVERGQTEKEKIRYYLILGLILLLGLIVKIVRLDIPPGYYFDEVYNAFTGINFLHGNREAYNPWSTPPVGFAYEWSHPPLPRLIMAAMMFVFGENCWGWRIGSVLFGSGCIALTALIALELFGLYSVSLLAAFLLSVEGMFFVGSRIAMSDVYFCFFSLLSVFLYLKWMSDRKTKSFVYVSVASGLMFATKWTAIYIYAVLFVDLLRYLYVARERQDRRTVAKLIGVFTILPIAVYVASYAQYFSLSYTWRQFCDLQYQMWYFHTHVNATHPYQSTPWQWVFDLMPIWMYTAKPAVGMVANIYNLGNPVILLFGFFSVLLLPFQRGISLYGNFFLLIIYFSLWLPWLFSPRIMFFYHYMPAVPFLCIIAAQQIVKMWRSVDLEPRVFATLLVGLSLGWFLFRYSQLSALPISESFANKYFWLMPGWR